MANRVGTVLHDLGERTAKRVPYSMVSLVGDNCVYCSIELTKYTRTKDHVVSLIENKRIRQLSNVSNFTVPCCRSCNSKKGKKNVGSDLFQDQKIEYFYYDGDVLDSVCEEIENVLKKSQRTADDLPIFEDEQDYLFTKHIRSDDFAYLYDPDILQLEELRRRFYSFVKNL